jgi:hypothetical protein
MDLVLIAGIAVVAYGALAAGLTIRAILKRRDRDYRALYAEFLERKKSVQSRMKGGGGNG